MDGFVIWVNWGKRLVSYVRLPGFEGLPFGSETSRRANIAILLAEGFRLYSSGRAVNASQG